MELVTSGGVMMKLIERNTAVHTRKGQLFTTHADTWSDVVTQVFQGERAMTTFN